MKPQLSRFIIDQLLNGSAVDDQQELLLSGLIDSIAVMRLVSFIEQETGLNVPPEDVVIENFTTINAIGDYLQARGV